MAKGVLSSAAPLWQLPIDKLARPRKGHARWHRAALKSFLIFGWMQLDGFFSYLHLVTSMKPGDELRVALEAPSSSSWSERVHLHPATLKNLGIQSASPALILLGNSASRPVVRIANLWPRSTMEAGGERPPTQRGMIRATDSSRRDLYTP
jgi:hypothetical protein